jgi:arginyl-tRNA synthetase
MLFNPEESIDFNGNTGPFIQYTYARIQSVLRKAQINTSKNIDSSAVAAVISFNGKEQTLLQHLNSYPDIVRQAGNMFSPAVIANYAYSLASDYNSFYHDYSILGEQNAGVRQMRLALSAAVAQVLRSAFDLLGIEMPQRM